MFSEAGVRNHSQFIIFGSMTFGLPFDWAALRAREFPGLGDAVYLNAASIAPLPARSRAAISEFNERRTRVQEMGEADFVDPPQRARRAAAQLINADPSEIALGANTSYGINLAAAGLRLPEGATVLISDREFPANMYPWMDRRRFRLEVVPTTSTGWPDEDAILRRVAEGNVGAVAISSVQFSCGYRADLARLGRQCREQGTLLIVDAIQSLGCIPMDVREMSIDILAAGGHKWLLGPLGVGFAYIRREIQDRVEPVNVGWSSMKASQDVDDLLGYRYDFVDDARRYEVATAPLQDFLGFASSVELLNDIGVGTVWQRVDSLLRPLRHYIVEHDTLTLRSPGDRERRSGILSFAAPDNAAAFARLSAKGVVCAVREGGIRIAPHLYNTESEIRTVIETLEELEAAGWT